MQPARIAALALLACLSAFPALANDAVRIENGGSGDAGVLADGAVGGQPVNDRRFTEPEAGSLFSNLLPIIPLENFVTSVQSNEIIAFAPGRPPRLVSGVPWTSASDKIVVELEDEYRIPVTAWIVEGPFVRQGQLAANHSVTTSRIWAEERQGLAFSSFQVVDATQDIDAPSFADFDCSLVNEIRNRIGANDPGINIYYVDAVSFGGDFLATNGVFCGGGTIAMGSTTSGGLLAHEIGHALSLLHPDAWTTLFDQSNVMHSSSSRREYLTEGQTFRSVFEPASALNAIYDVRSGLPTRGCFHTITSTDACPSMQTRIWNDGSFPANAGTATGGAAPAGAEAALNEFLSRDCEVGEDGESLARLLAHADEIAPVLERILRVGPAAEDLEALHVHLEESWARRTAFLDGDPALGLAAAEHLAVTRVSREEFVAQGRERFIDQCVERAAVGLAAIRAEHGASDLEFRDRRLRRARIGSE